MGIETYSHAIELATKSGRLVTCQYCGGESLVVGDIGMCPNCELPVHSGKEALQSGTSVIKELLGNVDYEGAAKAYDGLYKSSKDPSYLYAEALLRIRQSNLQIAGIRYDRQGFMEENTAFRDNAAKLASAARGLLNDAVNACAPQLNEQRPPLGIAYLAFICHMKLSNLREAGVVLHTIDGIDSAYLGTYARMMLDLNLGKPDAVIIDAERLLKLESFSINALFYIAVALFDKKRYGEARKLVFMLQPHLQNGQVGSLLGEIEEAAHV